MNIRAKAAMMTVWFFVFVAVTSIGFNILLQFISPDSFLKLMGLGVTTFLGYMVYSVLVSKLEYEQKLKEINSKK